MQSLYNPYTIPIQSHWTGSFPNPKGGRAQVGKLVQFLKAAQVKFGNPGKKAKVYNARLAKFQYPEDVRLEELDLALPGDWPWCGTKKCFRPLYEYVV